MFVCPGALCRRAAIVCMQACASCAYIELAGHGLACTSRMGAPVALRDCIAGKAAAACAELDAWGMGQVCAPKCHASGTFKYHALLRLHSNLHNLRVCMLPHTPRHYVRASGQSAPVNTVPHKPAGPSVNVPHMTPSVEAEARWQSWHRHGCGSVQHVMRRRVHGQCRLCQCLQQVVHMMRQGCSHSSAQLSSTWSASQCRECSSLGALSPLAAPCLRSRKQTGSGKSLPSLPWGLAGL
jgi:hypothetical protein